MPADYTLQEALKIMQLPKPKISSEEAAVMGTTLFTGGNECCPSILETVQKAYDIPQNDFIPWIGAGLQGGCSLGTEICGSVSSAIIFFGLWAYHQLTPPTKDNKMLANHVTMCYAWDYIHAFKNAFGSIRCEDLCGWWNMSPPMFERFIRLRLYYAHCAKYVSFACRTLCEWGEDPPPPPPPLDFVEMIKSGHGSWVDHLEQPFWDHHRKR